jgi:PAS domain S-box-containing protein
VIRNLIKICWFGSFACFAAVYGYLVWEWRLGAAPQVFVWLGALALVLWVYATVRVFRFRRRIGNLAKRLLDGDYETGIPTARQPHDESRALAELMNEVVGRLRTYDVLRAERVALNARTREILYENIDDAVIVADVDKRFYQFNPAARALFGVEQEKMTFDSINKREDNRQFATFFMDAVERNKVLEEARVVISLPIRDVSKEVSVKIIPVKDREEKVRLALIFLK